MTDKEKSKLCKKAAALLGKAYLIGCEARDLVKAVFYGELHLKAVDEIGEDAKVLSAVADAFKEGGKGKK